MVLRSLLVRSADTYRSSPTAGEMARAVAKQLNELARQVTEADDVFEKQARLRLEKMSQQLEEMRRGELTYSLTETWRTVYQSLLSNCQVKRYLSVALIEHEDYWRDQPGQASLEFNYDLVQHGFFVHRRFVIDEFLWPPGAVHPADAILSSIEEQATRGIEASVVRKSDLETEPGLVRDFGIYGNRAVGFQSVDDQARTTKYLLRFGQQAVEEAEELWKQLDLYAIPLDELLDRPA